MSVILIRALIIYLLLLLSLRILGKRQLGQMELSEFVLASMAADIASQPLQDSSIPLLNGLLPLLLIFSLEILIAHFAMKYPSFRSFLRGKPCFLIYEGQLQPAALRENRLSTDELNENLREKGCLSPLDVQYALLETDGSLSLILYPSAAPPTAKALGLKAEKLSYPRTVISSGRLMEENLSALGLKPKDLVPYLRSAGLKRPGEVFFMSLDEKGQAYIVKEVP